MERVAHPPIYGTMKVSGDRSKPLLQYLLIQSLSLAVWPARVCLRKRVFVCECVGG